MKIFDFYATKLDLNLNGKVRIKTTIGGFFSILIFLLIIFFSYFIGKDIVYKENPMIREEIIPNFNNELDYTINSLLYGVIFSIRYGENLTIFEDSSILNFKLINFQKNITSGKIISQKEIPMEKCSEKILRNMSFTYSSQYLDKNLCFDKNIIEIYGTEFNQIKSYLSIIIDKCKNSTFSNMEKQTICKSETYIEDIMNKNSFYFSFFYEEPNFNLTNYENPISYTNKEKWKYIDYRLSKISKFKLQSIILLTDIDWIFTSFTGDLAMTFEETHYDVVTYAQNLPLFQLRIESTNLIHKKLRSYIKIPIILSSIGGIIKIFFAVCYFLNSYVGNYEKDLIIMRDLFSVIKKEDENYLYNKENNNRKIKDISKDFVEKKNVRIFDGQNSEKNNPKIYKKNNEGNNFRNLNILLPENSSIINNSNKNLEISQKKNENKIFDEGIFDKIISLEKKSNRKSKKHIDLKKYFSHNQNLKNNLQLNKQEEYSSNDAENTNNLIKKQNESERKFSSILDLNFSSNSERRLISNIDKSEIFIEENNPQQINSYIVDSLNQDNFTNKDMDINNKENIEESKDFKGNNDKSNVSAVVIDNIFNKRNLNENDFINKNKKKKNSLKRNSKIDSSYLNSSVNKNTLYPLDKKKFEINEITDLIYSRNNPQKYILTFKQKIINLFFTVIKDIFCLKQTSFSKNLKIIDYLLLKGTKEINNYFNVITMIKKYNEISVIKNIVFKDYQIKYLELFEKPRLNISESEITEFNSVHSDFFQGINNKTIEDKEIIGNRVKKILEKYKKEKNHIDCKLLKNAFKKEDLN